MSAGAVAAAVLEGVAHDIFSFVGNPILASLVGVLISFALPHSIHKTYLLTPTSSSSTSSHPSAALCTPL